MRAEFQHLKALAVHLHGRRIGVISRLAGDRQHFAFDQDYLDDPHRPTLSLSFKGRDGGITTAVRAVTRRVPPFFSNLLPEGALRDYLAEKAGVHPEREFFLLAVLGEDLPGAVALMPLDAGSPDAHPPDQEEQESGTNGVLHFSLAGVQLKFSAVMETAGGLTIPAHGVGGSWIVKLPSLQFPSVPENEFVMLELARASGIEVPTIRLTPVREIHGLPEDIARLPGNALAVERFDRTPTRRIHMEDFAQVFGVFPDRKYEGRSYSNLAAVLWAEAGEEAVDRFVRRLAFSVLIGNGDMHLKNWSLLYPDDRHPVLSPAYDLVATSPYIPGDRLALTFGGSRSMSEITADQVRRFADTAGLALPPLQTAVRETVERTRNAWTALAAKDLLPADMLRTIDRQIEIVAANSRV